MTKVKKLEKRIEKATGQCRKRFAANLKILFDVETVILLERCVRDVAIKLIHKDVENCLLFTGKSLLNGKRIAVFMPERGFLDDFKEVSFGDSEPDSKTIQ